MIISVSCPPDCPCKVDTLTPEAVERFRREREEAEAELARIDRCKTMRRKVVWARNAEPSDPNYDEAKKIGRYMFFLFCKTGQQIVEAPSNARRRTSDRQRV